jgi:DNA-directed RNA polymerase subunit RPC12/RpoP
MSHDSEENLLPSRSNAERHFYLMVLPCGDCGQGPFELVSSERTADQTQDIWYIRCKHCGHGRRLLFDHKTLLIDESAAITEELPMISPSEVPSALIDVGQWLALFYRIIAAAADEKDRKEAQRLGYEATLCLEEAVKFYHADSDLPPPDAVWTENSKQRLKEHPEMFIRSRLLQMREKLPSIQVMRQNLAKSEGHNGQKKKHWWNKWFSK